MYPARTAFLNQIAYDAASHRTVLSMIEQSQRLAKDGEDITQEVAANARQRLDSLKAYWRMPKGPSG